MKALLITLLVTLGLAAAAEARQVRWPATGTPAITVEVPDDWTNAPDTRGVNLLLRNATGAVSFSIYLGKVPAQPGDLGMLASAVKTSLGPSVQSYALEGPGTFRGYVSEVYNAAISRDGKIAQTRLTFYRIDDANIGSVSLLTGSTATAADKAQAAAVFDSIRVIAK
jgi:hypothetical protein